MEASNRRENSGHRLPCRFGGSFLPWPHEKWLPRGGLRPRSGSRANLFPPPVHGLPAGQRTIRARRAAWGESRVATPQFPGARACDPENRSRDTRLRGTRRYASDCGAMTEYAGSFATPERLKGQHAMRRSMPWQSPVKHLRRSSLDCQRTCDRNRAMREPREEIERYLQSGMLDPHFVAWSGDVTARGRQGRAALKRAPIEAVESRESGGSYKGTNHGPRRVHRAHGCRAHGSWALPARR